MASAKELAYMRAFGLKDEAVLQNPEHQKVLNGATADVMSHMGLFKGETERNRDERLEIESALSGESVELADYFKKVFPERFAVSTSWDIIFAMYKDMTGADKTDEAEVVQALMGRSVGEQATANTSEASDQSINKSNNSKLQEEKEMSNSNLDTALDNLKSTGGLAPQTDSAAMPAVDDATKAAAVDAARAVINKDRNDRIAFTRAAKVTKGIAMQPALAKRVKPGSKAVLVKDGDAATAEKKAEKIYKNFCDKTGRRVAESGAVMYDKVRPDSIEDAKKVDQFLVELKNNPTMQLDMQDPSKSEQLKGGYVTTPDHPEEVPMTQKEILQIIIEKTLGRLNTGVAESQFIVRKAINRTSTAGAQGSEAVSTNSDPWKGVAVVSVVKKAEFEKAGYAYAYALDESQEVMTGVRIQLPGKVYCEKNNGATTNEQAEVKYAVFTVSGFAPAYGTKLVEALKKFERKERTAVGSDNARVLDFNNDADIEASLENFNNVIASYLAANKGNVPEGASDVFKDAADIMQENASKSVAKEASEMAGIDA